MQKIFGDCGRHPVESGERERQLPRVHDLLARTAAARKQEQRNEARFFDADGAGGAGPAARRDARRSG